MACAHQICCSPSARFARHGRPSGPLSIHWECLIWPSAFRLYPDGCGTQKRLSHGGICPDTTCGVPLFLPERAFLRPRTLPATLTCDRGKEFLGFRQVNEALQGKRCSRHPGCPGERALHEQGNGLLRRFFPRRRDFSRLTNKETARAVVLRNHRPGKKSGHLSTAGQPREKGILLAVRGRKCLGRSALKPRQSDAGQGGFETGAQAEEAGLVKGLADELHAHGHIAFGGHAHGQGQAGQTGCRRP